MATRKGFKPRKKFVPSFCFDREGQSLQLGDNLFVPSDRVSYWRTKKVLLLRGTFVAYEAFRDREELDDYLKAEEPGSYGNARIMINLVGHNRPRVAYSKGVVKATTQP